MWVCVCLNMCCVCILYAMCIHVYLCVCRCVCVCIESGSVVRWGQWPPGACWPDPGPNGEMRRKWGSPGPLSSRNSNYSLFQMSGSNQFVPLEWTAIRLHQIFKEWPCTSQNDCFNLRCSHSSASPRPPRSPTSVFIYGTFLLNSPLTYLDSLHVLGVFSPSANT